MGACSPVRHVGVEVLGQVDDLDRLKGALLRRADANENVSPSFAARGRVPRVGRPRAGTLVQMLQPMHSSSEIHAILSFFWTSMQNLPIRTTGQDFLHSSMHFEGLHFSAFTMAIRVSVFSSFVSLSFLPMAAAHARTHGEARVAASATKRRSGVPHLRSTAARLQGTSAGSGTCSDPGRPG